MKKLGIVNVNLEYVIPEDVYTGLSDEDAEKAVENYLENIELPDNYVEDSFEIVKTIDADEKFS